MSADQEYPPLALMMLAGIIPMFGYGLPGRPGKWDTQSEYAHKTLPDDLQAEKVRKAQEKRERKAKRGRRQ